MESQSVGSCCEDSLGQSIGFVRLLECRRYTFAVSEKQRSECGKQYAEVPLQATEPDGHEIIADREQQVGPPRLTGCFASLRPRYLRRKLHEEFPREIWKTAFCSDYRRLVIQNHFHKCTKSCFKKILDQFSAFFVFDRKFLS